MQIVSWGSTLSLAKKLSKDLNCDSLTPEVSKFKNNETRVYIDPKKVKESVTVLVTFEESVNSKLIELFLVVDVLRNLGVKEVHLILPWLPYSPQDKIFREGEPLSSRVLLQILNSLGVDTIKVVDIHSELIATNSKLNFKSINPTEFYAKYLKSNLINKKVPWKIAILDKGSSSKAQKLADLLQLKTVRFEKKRCRETGEVIFVNFEGDVEGFHILTYDDFISTGSTLFKSAEILKGMGALSVSSIVTHAPVRSTLSLIQESHIDRLILTNSFNYDLANEIKMLSS